MMRPWIPLAFLLAAVTPAAFAGDPGDGLPLTTDGVSPRAILAGSGSVVLSLDAQSVPEWLALAPDRRVEVVGGPQETAHQYDAQKGVLVVSFVPVAGRYGPIDLLLDAGASRYLIRRATYVVGPPVYSGSLPADASAAVTARRGSRLRVRVPGAPPVSISCALGTATLFCRAVDLGGEAEVQLPETTDGSTRLRVSVFGSTVEERALRWIEAPVATDVALDLAPAGKVHATVRGSDLDREVWARLVRPGAAPLELVPVRDAADAMEYATAAAIDVGTGGAFDVEVGWAGSVVLRAQGHWEKAPAPGAALNWRCTRISSPCEAVVRLQPAGDAADLGGLADRLEHPGRTRVRAAGVTLDFVAVPAAPWLRFGLTRAQRDDADLLRRNLVDPPPLEKGPLVLPLLRAFFIQEREVTVGQYLQYLKAARPPAGVSVPPALAHVWPSGGSHLSAGGEDLPVTGVNYRDAASFAAWLDGELATLAPGWRIRLPHEVEWEMAARPDERLYVVPDAEAGAFTRSLAAAPRGGGIVADRTWVGARGMAGGVREWTATVFDRELMLKLDVGLRSGRLVGWDPGEATPAADVIRELPTEQKSSALMSIRGGANGEIPPLPQVSVRRTGESSTAYPDVGFRLVIVPRGAP